MEVVELLCPVCRDRLEVRSGQRVHVCAGCGRSAAGLPGPGALWPVPRARARARRPSPEGSSVVALPVWVVDLPDGLPRREILPPEIRLPAVGGGSLARLVEQARRWTGAGGTLATEEIASYRPAPADLGVEEAWAVAEVVLLAHDETWPGDELPPDFQAPFGPPRLVDLPCARVPGGLMDLIWGLSVDSALWRGLPLPMCPGST